MRPSCFYLIQLCFALTLRLELDNVIVLTYTLAVFYIFYCCDELGFKCCNIVMFCIIMLEAFAFRLFDVWKQLSS